MTTTDWVKAISIALPVLGLFIEITPVKFNPITSILNFLGSRINKKLNDELKDLKELIHKIDSKVDENEIHRLRQEILSFSNSCQRGIRHSKDEFEHIIDSNSRYHAILESRGMENGQIDIEYNYIISIYKKCIEEKKFI